MWKFVTEKRAPDDIVLCLPDPAKATSKEAADKMKAANTEIVNALATDKTTMTTKRGVKRKAANNHYTPEKIVVSHLHLASLKKKKKKNRAFINTVFI
jgi:hypothetical protein